MLEKKIYGSIFLPEPTDSFTMTEICELTNEKKDKVKKVLDKLVKDKKLTLKKNRYQLK